MLPDQTCIGLREPLVFGDSLDPSTWTMWLSDVSFAATMAFRPILTVCSNLERNPPFWSVPICRTGGSLHPTGPLWNSSARVNGESGVVRTNLKRDRDAAHIALVVATAQKTSRYPEW